MTQVMRQLEALNRWLTPLARLGLGSPTVMQPTGLVVVEVAGRRSGVIRQVPVLGLLVPGGVLVSTVRRNSQWLKNLAAAERAHLWLWGHRFEVEPAVIVPGDEAPDAVPPWLAALVAGTAERLDLNVAWLGFRPLPARA